MKKLRLNLEQLNNTEVLTRSQLRNVLGGGGLITTLPGGGGETTVPGGSCEGECVGDGPNDGCHDGKVCRDVPCGNNQTEARCVDPSK